MYPLHSVHLKIPTLKFSHNYFILTYCSPLMSILFHSFIAAFTRHSSRHTDHLGESFTLFSPMDYQSSLLLIQESRLFLTRNLHLNVDGNYSGHFIVSVPLTLVYSIHIWMQRYPLLWFAKMKSFQSYIPGLLALRKYWALQGRNISKYFY